MCSTKLRENENDKSEEPKAKEPTTNFEKIEVAKGVSNMGYTAITLVKEIPVKIGISDDDYIELKDGVSAGAKS